MMNWRLAEAKDRLSEVLSRALANGPRGIRRRDRVVAVRSEADGQRLTGEGESLTDSLSGGPDLSRLDLTRDPRPMREVEG